MSQTAHWARRSVWASSAPIVTHRTKREKRIFPSVLLATLAGFERRFVGGARGCESLIARRHI